jgi:uncharacterized protein (TIGR00156 family)
MRSPTRWSLIVLAATALASSLASAQYAGPSSTPAYKSVADVLKNPVDDAQVVLEGYVTKQVGKKKYLFSDGTGEIRVEIEGKHFPTATPINEKTKVQIRGEIEKDFMQSPEIDVDQLTRVK